MQSRLQESKRDTSHTSEDDAKGAAEGDAVYLEVGKQMIESIDDRCVGVLRRGVNKKRRVNVEFESKVDTTEPDHARCVNVNVCKTELKLGTF